MTFADPVAAGQLLFTSGLLWDAAKHDAAAAGVEPVAYLDAATQAVASFFDMPEADNLPRVVNQATLASLGMLGNDAGKGLMVLLTGPRSVGKSLMLRKVAAHLKKTANRHMVIFDARQHGSDLVRGIVAALAVDRTLLKAVLEEAPPVVAAGISALVAATVPPALALPGLSTRVETIVHSIAKLWAARTAPPAEVRLDELLGAFIAACKRRREYPIIVIDEANKALAATDPASAQRTLDLLDLLTRLSKQEREASVVLATSEHGLPLRLRALGYNTGHISDTIVAGEVPPAVMKGLLTGTWGCGEQLATTLLSLYGGHVLHASAAVRALATAADPGTIEGVAALGSVIGAPARCLDDSTLAAAGVPDGERDKLRNRVLAALRALVVDGFVALDSDTDKVAEVISLAHAGCVIPRQATASVPPKAWHARTPSGKTPKSILVPSSHIMRLLIARKAFPLPQASTPAGTGGAA